MTEIWHDDTSAYLDLKRYVVSVLMKGLGHELVDLPSRSAYVITLATAYILLTLVAD